MKWISSLAECSQCGRQWAVVYPENLEMVACPSCGYEDELEMVTDWINRHYGQTNAYGLYIWVNDGEWIKDEINFDDYLRN